MGPSKESNGHFSGKKETYITDPWGILSWEASGNSQLCIHVSSNSTEKDKLLGLVSAL